MSEHGRFQQFMAIYEDLREDEREEVDVHLHVCSECAATLAAYRAMDRMVHNLVEEKLQTLGVLPAVPTSQAVNRSRLGANPHAAGMVGLVHGTLLPRQYGFRLVSAVVFLLLLMLLSALFGGWGPFEEPVMASTPTVEQPKMTTSSTSLRVAATPVVVEWSGEPVQLLPVYKVALAANSLPLRVATPAPSLEQTR